MGRIDEKKQNNIILKNSVFSIGFKVLSYLLSFFTTPLLLNCLGDAKYGVYVTALSFISWIYYFDFGIGSGLRNKITEALVKGDYDTAQKSVNVSYFIVSVISLCAFVIILIASFFFDFDEILNAKLSDENLNMILLIAIFIACINFILSLSKNILFSIHKIALVDGFGIASRFIMLVAIWIYSIFGNALILVIVVIEGIFEVVKNMSASIYLKNKYSYLSPSFSQKIDMSYSKGILSFGLLIFLMQISALVLNATDNLIIMKLFGSTDVTPYNLGHKYFSVINAFFVAATGSLWTTYTTAYAVKDASYIRKTLKRALIFYSVTFIGIVIAYFIFEPFMKIYLGRELTYQTGLICLIGLYYSILIFSHNFSAFVHGISKVKLGSIACAVGAIFNIPCSVFFAKTCGLGLNGVILGSIVSLLISTPCYVYTTLTEIKKLEK